MYVDVFFTDTYISLLVNKGTKKNMAIKYASALDQPD